MSVLAQLTDCVRIYSVDQGLEQVAGIAQKLGLKVMQGFWLSNDPAKNRIQIEGRGRLGQSLSGYDPRGDRR
ncbi:MAG: hypothetical protein WDN48_17910, partial [Pseudolabrys sp.]